MFEYYEYCIYSNIKYNIEILSDDMIDNDNDMI